MTYAATSAAAWRAHDPSRVNAIIFSEIERAGPGGITVDQIELNTGLDHQTVSANVSHLKNSTMGTFQYLQGTGVKVPTRSGRHAEKLTFRAEVGAPKSRGPKGRGTSEKLASPKNLSGSQIAELRSLILEWIALEPSTCDEVEQVLGLSHQTCSARIRELVVLGRIKSTGVKRRTRQNRPARVMCVVQ